MSWCGTKSAATLLNNLSDVIVFDLETTGIDTETAEILQIAICDGNGCCLFSSYVRPTRHKSWKVAEKANGISPQMVADAPTFSKIRSEVQEAFNRGKVVAGYNCKRFDIPIIERYGIVLPSKCFDVMSEFGVYHPIGRHRLKDCADFCGIYFSPHDAAEDARATADCMRKLLEMPGFVVKQEKRYSHEEQVEVPKENRPLLGRLFGFLFQKHKFHPIIFGLLLVVVGTGVLYRQVGGSFLNIDKELLTPSILFSAAKASKQSLLFGALIPVGVFFVIKGIIKTIKMTVLWVINIFRKIFD